MPRGPAYFAAKDTRNKPAESRDIATSPEEIRRKLDRRQSPEDGGASFKGKDMESIGDVSETAEHEAGDIAQTAEAIREKLAERQPASQGKATFEGKDIDNPNERYSTPPPPRPRKEPEEPPPTSGKAAFEAKDLTPKR